MSEKSPENKEAPNASEKKPKQQPSEQTARNVGKTAVRGSGR
jgi:hypothetical protein